MRETGLMCLVLVRGLSGSGKTTLCEKVVNTSIRVHPWGDGPAWTRISADDHFMVDGEYCFDPSKLPAAHKECQDLCRGLLSTQTLVLVDNTFSSRWEMEPYLQMANEAGVEVVVVDLYNGGLTCQELFERNSHGVPLATIVAMKERWEFNWKDGNPLPPWER